MVNLYKSLGYPVKKQTIKNVTSVADSNSFTNNKFALDKSFGAIKAGRGRRILKINGKSGTKSI